MKYYRIFFFISIFCYSFSSEAQSSDTLTYLNHIVATKSNYIGRPFSVLLDSLQLPIKAFNISTYRSQNLKKESSILIGFAYANTPETIDLTFPRLEIIWQIPNDAIATWDLYRIYDGAWNPSVQGYYQNKIILDLFVIE
ncbi:MAG TPA: hypothetical protein PKN96_11845 [Flavobacterium sp.]|uniref:hypothetical protein n=1 Tax=Flavobacterium sp. TaxID=239 RepID=UPI002CD89CDC|nr:hypothetical protein [Flavobacterium sp.]HNP33975.1 hypothetical protein [Flavobacterium sp.]